MLQFDYERKDGTEEVFEATVVQGDFTVRFIDGQNEEFWDWDLDFDPCDHDGDPKEVMVPDTAYIHRFVRIWGIF